MKKAVSTWTVRIIAALFCALAAPVLADELPRIAASVTPVEIVLRWPSTATHFALETAAHLNEASWSSVPYPVGIRDGLKSVRLQLSDQQRFLSPDESGRSA